MDERYKSVFLPSVRVLLDWNWILDYETEVTVGEVWDEMGTLVSPLLLNEQGRANELFDVMQDGYGVDYITEDLHGRISKLELIDTKLNLHWEVSKIGPSEHNDREMAIATVENATLDIDLWSRGKERMRTTRRQEEKGIPTQPPKFFGDNLI